MARLTDTLAPVATAGLRPAPAIAPDQAAVFRRLRVRLLRNGLRVLLENGRVKLVTMVATSLVVALFVFALSWYGFRELFRFNVPGKGLIVGGLFDLMFFTLGAMLLISTGIILYASLFTAPEARYLLTTPARADRVFAAKFQAAVGFSSWAFVILGLPILVTYGLVVGVPWFYYPLLPAYLLGFVILPGAVSSLACLLIVRLLPRNRKQALVLAGVVLAVVAVVWGRQVLQSLGKSTVGAGGRDALQGLVGNFALTQHPLAPSHWMTNGVMAAARGEVAGALLPLALLWSHGLLAYLVAAYAAKRLYRTAYDRIAGGGSGKRVYRGNVLDTLMEWSVFYLAKPTRILIVKDFRTFRRDPTQWVLLVIFAGMVLVGATNYRFYVKNDLARMDRFGLSLINLAGTGVLLCAGLSRFIFPLVSLEGRKFWILGLLPLRREQILFGKFAFAATGSVLIAEALIVTSDLLIGLPAGAVAAHALTAAVIAVGLSGLNVGLGAYMPNFRETDPSKIVVGFGGTVNMVIGLLFLLAVVGVMSGPLHVAALGHWLRQEAGATLPLWAYAGLPFGLLLGAAAVVLPLRAGARALRNTEF